MEEGAIQIYGVVVATLLFAYTERAGPAQAADARPSGTSRRSHGIRDLADGAVGVDGYVEDDSAVAGYEVEGVDEIAPPSYSHNILPRRASRFLPNVNLRPSLRF